MEEKKTQKERIQWHPGFFAGIQIELEEDAENPLYDSVMNLIVRTNQDKFEEVRDMCEALEELMKDKIEEKVKLAAKAAYEQAEKECMERGEEIGKEIGENRVNNLIVLLSKSGRMDDIVKAAQDKAYQNKLFKEFDL